MPTFYKKKFYHKAALMLMFKEHYKYEPLTQLLMIVNLKKLISAGRLDSGRGGLFRVELATVLAILGNTRQCCHRATDPIMPHSDRLDSG